MRLWNAQIVKLFIAILATLQAVHAYKFLGVLHFSSKSHFIVGSALMKGLVEQGHEVTVISPFPLKKPLKNYHDVPVPSVLKLMEKDTGSLLDTLKRSVVENIVNFHNIGVEVTETVLNEPAVKQLMASNQTFDAVICEVFLSEALYGLSELFQAPLIGLGTFGAIAWNTDMDTGSLLDTLKRSVVENIVNFHNIGVEVTETVLNEPAVKQLMASNQTFDAVICEVFLSEALYGLSELFKAPLIGLGTFGAIAWNTDMVGSPSPPSYVPSTFLPFTDHMSLGQRIGNLAFSTFERLFLDLYYLPKQDKIFRKYFPHSERSLSEIRKNAALVLLNSHVSLSFARPYVPNQIEVGGMHINRKRTPLPQDIEKFINESEHGVVYFSMGSNIKSTTLPVEKRQEIMTALKSLKQRVLWKFEDPQLEGKPDNVFISDWFPQDDILAHDNVKVFITHGGLLSTTESIYHGKPFIGIPIFGDQFLNMARAEKNGYGIMLDYNNLTAVSLHHAVVEMTGNAKYTELVRAMSERYRDQPMEPLQKAIYWVEHVARHKGAKYLHCAGLDLSFVEYHSIDAIVILYGGLLFVVGVVLWLLKCLLGCVCGRKSSGNKQKVKKH